MHYMYFNLSTTKKSVTDNSNDSHQCNKKKSNISSQEIPSLVKNATGGVATGEGGSGGLILLLAEKLFHAAAGALAAARR